MSLLVVVLLVGLWGWILAPGAIRARRSASPLESVTAFERSMSMIAPLGRSSLPGRHVLVLQHPPSVTGGTNRVRLLRRRRAALLRLTGLTAVTGALALAFGGVFTVLFTLTVLALGTFVVLLVEARTRAEEARRKTRRLRPGRTAPVSTRAAYVHRRGA